MNLNRNYEMLLVIIIFLLLFSCNSIDTNINIIGTWKGKYNNHEVSFIFKSDKTCFIKFFDKEINNFETINGNYELDFSKKPIPLSIRDIPQLNHSLYTIVEFNGNDLIKIAEFSPKWRLRPISFNANTTLILKSE